MTAVTYTVWVQHGDDVDVLTVTPDRMKAQRLKRDALDHCDFAWITTKEQP